MRKQPEVSLDEVSAPTTIDLLMVKRRDVAAKLRRIDQSINECKAADAEAVLARAHEVLADV